MEKTALFAGTFNPFTIGHANIVARSLPLFGRIVIGVAASKGKHTALSAEERAQTIRRIYADEPKVEVVPYSDMTLDLAKRMQADCLIRGIRSVKDFEMERQLADFNRRFGGIETLILVSEPELESLSSSLVRELQSFGKDVSALLPTPLKAQE